MERLFERFMDWLFPCRVTLRSLKELSEKLSWIVRALGICPDCEKSLEECTCDVKYKREMYETEEGSFVKVTLDDDALREEVLTTE